MVVCVPAPTHVLSIPAIRPHRLILPHAVSERRTTGVTMSPKVERYSGIVEDFLYRIEQRALPLAHVVEVVPR